MFSGESVPRQVPIHYGLRRERDAQWKRSTRRADACALPRSGQTPAQRPQIYMRTYAVRRNVPSLLVGYIFSWA